MATAPIMILLAIDPGNDTGWAWFSDGHLCSCGVSNPRENRLHCDELVIELPQIYVAARSKGDPNDLIVVAVQVGEYKEAFNKAMCTLVKPREWKGQVPKGIHHARIHGKLDPIEQGIVAMHGKGLGAKLHNMMDAVALGLWYLKRCGVGGT